ncbi:hypothetical protein FOMPIDRAFT_118505 [Fomitopsis schrenkii]|uniref:Uncharacterized protein n=1 Tax=Fomitopsis schrenkii TaxID=2126942 RepID=S8E4D4_FOMSC|nr:hypothetical protein FOMPIDRAFT_118505 [Fomitopsis schrenkii]
MESLAPPFMPPLVSNALLFDRTRAPASVGARRPAVCVSLHPPGRAPSSCPRRVAAACW